MTTEWQLTIDCADPAPLVRFWSLALGYVPLEPPNGLPTWRAWYLSIGVPEEELGEGDCTDRLRDPEGRGPNIWFQGVPEAKVVKNRLHLDLKVSGGRSIPMVTRKERVDVKVAILLAAGATVSQIGDYPDQDHYFVVMQDPEGNEFCVA